MLRQLPAVDALLNHPTVAELQILYGRSLTLDALRSVLDEIRDAIRSNRLLDAPNIEYVASQAANWLESQTTPSLTPVINATGIIVHTNLGRAPLSESALAAVSEISSGYSTLEYDIERGQRGSRSVHAAKLLRQVIGCDDALVVNNNAAAILLLLSALCAGREIIISRGQLIEIGGGFRVPDVMAQSGAKLVEVGTTNRTHLHDYERAITADTAAILVAHSSNFKILGYTSEPSLDELAQLAQAHDLPLLYDQGSGALLDVSQFGLEAEPTVSESLGAGVDVIAFSGDKLLGGPQAGILCGRGDLIAAARRHPLARAVRADKMCLAALVDTLGHYLRGDALDAIPVWQMISRLAVDVQQEAEAWTAFLREANIPATTAPGESRVGGGSLPGSMLATTLVAIAAEDIERFAARLRQSKNPVIGRIQDDLLLLDPRTVLPLQAETLLQTVISEYSTDE